MRIASPTAPPVPVVPLSSEASRALIASGVFQHSPNQVLWTVPGHAAASLGGPLESAAWVDLAGGICFEPRLFPKSDESLSRVLLDVAKQSGPFLDQLQLDGVAADVADGVALLAAYPEILKILARSDGGNAQKIFVYATVFVKLLSFVNHVAPIPHVGTALDVVAPIFKIGDQVFITGEKLTGAG